MKRDAAYAVGAGEQDLEGMEGEGSAEDTAATPLWHDRSGRCPICLSRLSEKEVGFPESCSHVFCASCILKWAETLASCPIDRKPFQVVLRCSTLEGCVKIQVKKQRRETKDKKNEGFLKEQLSCYESCKSCIRRGIFGKEGVLRSGDDGMSRTRGTSPHGEAAGKKQALVKPRRTDQCGSVSTCLSRVFSWDSYTGEASLACLAYCAEFIEVSEVSEVIRQKRQELGLSWFPDAVLGTGRIGFTPWNTETGILPVISPLLPRAVFPTCPTSFENFDFSCKGYALAQTQEGEEKKQASGAATTRGSRRRSAAATPTRRSTRNTRVDTVSPSQKSPVSSGSGCDAPGGSNPPVRASSAAESQKPARQPAKRKPVRRGRKPLLKKKLRSSAPPEEPASGDSVDEETAEPAAPPVPEREATSDVEASASAEQAQAEGQAAEGLKSPSEPVEGCEDHAEHCDAQEQGERAQATARAADPGEDLLTPAGGGEAAAECSEGAMSPCPVEEGGHAPSSTPPATRAQDGCAPSQLPGEGRQPESAPEDAGLPSALLSAGDREDPPGKPEELLEKPMGESAEEEVTQAGDPESGESLGGPLLACTESGDAEITAAGAAPESKGSRTVQESEKNSSQNHPDAELDTSSKAKAEPLVEALVEAPPPVQLPATGGETREMAPVGCALLCSDRNESETEPSMIVDSEQLSEECVAHGSENDMPPSDAASDKVDSVSPPAGSPAEAAAKARKPRARRSRFHSPSTTWSPSRETAQEKKRVQSPSPKRETGRDDRAGPSPSPQKESARGRRRSRSHSPRKDVSREGRRSQSPSPKREGAREGKRPGSASPRRDPCRESRRSRSKGKDSSSREKSRSRSRERERGSRRWSRSRSRSRSPSRSRTKRKGSLSGRSDRHGYSPRWKDRWARDGWRCPRGSGRCRRGDPEKQRENTRRERNELSPGIDEPGCAGRVRDDCPSWVTEKISSRPDPRTRPPGKPQESHWEENRNENSGSTWNRNFGSGWTSNRGRGHRGRGAHRGHFAHTDQRENRWQSRKPLSGNSNSSGDESFKFAEQQSYKRKSEPEFSFDTPADRSGWTSASSWAVRKTLPADVQNYYSRRGRSASGSQSTWIRQEEETADQDCNLKDQTSQQVDGSQLPLTTLQPPPLGMVQPPPVNMYPYPVGVPAPMLGVQRGPFPMHPQLPLHLPAGMPLLQVAAPAVASQGPPPPPPPPPPAQQVSYEAPQPEGKQLQAVPSASHGSNNSTAVLPAPPAAPGTVGTVPGPGAGSASSSGHGRASNAAGKLADSKGSGTVEASADSSKTDKKLQIQEKAAQEVKLAIKPFYQNKDITKEEYKEIVRKAVDKVCHSRSGEVNSTKVANLVKAYVDKYKYSRKGSQKKTLEETVSTEKHVG